MTENYRDKALKNALFFPFLWECGRGPADTRSTAGFPASPGGSSLLFTFLFSQARAARGFGAGKSRSGKQPKVKAEPEAQIIAAVTPPRHRRAAGRAPGSGRCLQRGDNRDSGPGRAPSPRAVSGRPSPVPRSSCHMQLWKLSRSPPPPRAASRVFASPSTWPRCPRGAQPGGSPPRRLGSVCSPGSRAAASYLSRG